MTPTTLNPSSYTRTRFTKFYEFVPFGNSIAKPFLNFVFENFEKIRNKKFWGPRALYVIDFQSFRDSFEFYIYYDNFLLDFNFNLPCWGSIWPQLLWIHHPIPELSSSNSMTLFLLAIPKSQQSLLIFFFENFEKIRNKKFWGPRAIGKKLKTW